MSKQVDANEINKVMVERANLNRQLLQSKTQLNHQTTLKRKSELTQQELAELSDDTVVYRAIGRMFLRDNLKDIKSEITTIIDSSSAEATKLEKSVEVLQKKVTDLDKDIKDMMALN